jgi:hypothetical protein
MERITERDTNCADPKEIYGVRVKNHDYISAANRLADYEDTGLTPEEFHAYWVFLEDMIGEQKASEALDRFRQLVKADKDGRLVVLPCKVGTATYYIHYPIVVYPDKSEPEIKRGIFTLCDLDRVGYSVFLTREEAEKALEAMKK